MSVSEVFSLRLISLLLSMLCLCIAASTGTAPLMAATPKSADDTLAFELLRMERQVRTLPPDAESRLRTVLDDAVAALGPNPHAPTTSQEFVDFSERIAISLARHNYIQPVMPADWLESIGQALSPVPTSNPRLTGYLRDPQNAERVRYANPADPYYFLDCDMAALLFMSVAQMVGFDLNLVEVPKHNFVRWLDGRGGYENWDWTRWGSFRNENYVAYLGIRNVAIIRKTFLASQTDGESRGYFIAALANVADPVRRLELRRRAVALAPNNLMTANNAAWDFATLTSGVSNDERKDAVAYSLGAWAGDPSNASYMDTVACSFASSGDRDLAAAIETQAIRLATPGNEASYRSNLQRIRRGELCQ